MPAPPAGPLSRVAVADRPIDVGPARSMATMRVVPNRSFTLGSRQPTLSAQYLGAAPTTAARFPASPISSRTVARSCRGLATVPRSKTATKPRHGFVHNWSRKDARDAAADGAHRTPDGPAPAGHHRPSRASQRHPHVRRSGPTAAKGPWRRPRRAGPTSTPRPSPDQVAHNHRTSRTHSF